MRGGLSEAIWASAVQWARVGIGGVFFLIAARSLPLAEIGAFATAAAPLRLLQVIHKGGVEDAAVTLSPEEPTALSALHRLSILLGLAAAGVAICTAPLLDQVSPEAGIAAMTSALAAASLFHGVAAVPDGLLRREARFRSLAIRTFVGQLVAAAIGLASLAWGAGPWALVVFTLAQAAVAAGIALTMTGWPTGPAGPLAPVARKVWPLAARVMVGGIVPPLLQIAIGAVGGLAAAGVWQIATRIISLLEALTVVPLRFIALPRLARGGTRIEPLLAAASVSGVWVMGGIALTAPTLVTALLGTDSAPVTTTLRILCAGAIAGGGIAMLNQSLIAAGHGPDALRISVVSALAAALSGMIALAFGGAPEAMALSQVAAGIVPLALLLHGAGSPLAHLVVLLRPWLALLPMGLAVVAVTLLGQGLPASALFAAQAAAGTIGLALALPVVAPNFLRRSG